MELSSIVSSDITVTWNSTLVEFPETENIVFLSSSGPGLGYKIFNESNYSITLIIPRLVRLIVIDC